MVVSCLWVVVTNKFAFYKDHSAMTPLEEGKNEDGAGGRWKKGGRFIVCPVPGMLPGDPLVIPLS